MTPLQVVTTGLAAARLTQLIVDDEITRPIRERVQAQSQVEAPDAVMTAWEQVDTAINCHACSSVWAGAGVLLAGRAGPVGRFLVSVLAASQLALATKAVIERIDR